MNNEQVKSLLERVRPAPDAISAGGQLSLLVASETELEDPSLSADGKVLGEGLEGEETEYTREEAGAARAANDRR